MPRRGKTFIREDIETEATNTQRPQANARVT